MGFLISSSFLQTTFKSKQRRESPIDFCSWSNYAMMKPFEGRPSQYQSLIDCTPPAAFPGVAITDSRDFISRMPTIHRSEYFADSNLGCNQFSSMSIADAGGNEMALPHHCDLCLGNSWLQAFPSQPPPAQSSPVPLPQPLDTRQCLVSRRHCLGSSWLLAFPTHPPPPPLPQTPSNVGDTRLSTSASV